MFVSRSREKLINAIVFFVQNTSKCNTTKLFKLINFLDFEHFRQTGRSVTRLQYSALPQGPVPLDFFNEVKNPGPDLTASVGVSAVKDPLTDDIKRRDFNPRVQFNPRVFTRRELEIMHTLAELFRDLSANDISKYSHSKALPWKRIYVEGKPAAPIPYELAMECEAILKNMPTLDSEEYNYRQE